MFLSSLSLTELTMFPILTFNVCVGGYIMFHLEYTIRRNYYAEQEKLKRYVRSFQQLDPIMASLFYAGSR